LNVLQRKGWKDAPAYGRAMVHRFLKERSKQRDAMVTHCRDMRRAHSRGPLTPAMRAYGLLRLMRSMRFRRGDAAVAGRVREAQERLMALDRE
jgi:hypothetical protein